MVYSSRGPPTPPDGSYTPKALVLLALPFPVIPTPGDVGQETCLVGFPGQRGKVWRELPGPSHVWAILWGQDGHHSSVHKGPAAASATVDWSLPVLDSDKWNHLACQFLLPRLLLVCIWLHWVSAVLCEPLSS